MSSDDQPGCLGSTLEGRVQQTVAQPILAKRLKFKHVPAFDAGRHFECLLLRAAYVRPEVLWLPRECWPKVQRVKVHASREEHIRIFEKWDSVGCLHLLDAVGSESDYRCGLFSVYKNETVESVLTGRL
eukprot:1683780-Amphidinium_carterae.1